MSSNGFNNNIVELANFYCWVSSSALFGTQGLFSARMEEGAGLFSAVWECTDRACRH
jgi:hypothetical protein